MQLRRDPPAQVCAPHHVLSLQVPEGGRSAAPGTVCGADDAAVPTFIFKIEAVLGMRFCDPEQLIAKKRRNKLAAADKAICYLTRGKFRVDRHDDGYTDTWVEHMNCGKSQLNSALRKHRQAEQQQMRQLPSLRRAWSRRRS